MLFNLSFRSFCEELTGLVFKTYITERSDSSPNIIPSNSSVPSMVPCLENKVIGSSCLLVFQSLYIFAGPSNSRMIFSLEINFIVDHTEGGIVLSPVIVDETNPEEEGVTVLE